MRFTTNRDQIRQWYGDINPRERGRDPMEFESREFRAWCEVYGGLQVIDNQPFTVVFEVTDEAQFSRFNGERYGQVEE